ncbi:hypothetical protein THAOC_01679, partial [Thalassiosira oceanica]
DRRRRDGQATRAVVRPGHGHGEDGPGLGQEAHGRGGPGIRRPDEVGRRAGRCSHGGGGRGAAQAAGRARRGARRPVLGVPDLERAGSAAHGGGGAAASRGPGPAGPGRGSENAEPNNVPTEAVEEEADEMTYAPYRPSKLRYGLAHPDPVVENATLAAVEPPDSRRHLQPRAAGGHNQGAETVEGSPVLPDETQEAGIVQAEASPGEAQGDSSSEFATAQQADEDPIHVPRARPTRKHTTIN